MKSVILKRIELLEKEAGNKAIEEKDKIIIVPYPNNDEEAFERGLKERMAELRGKYGHDISEDDLLIVGIKKFSTGRE